MAERLHPGVYVEEVSGGVRPIEGVSTSTAAFLGECGRGIPALAQFVTGFAEFERAFGGHAPGDAGLLAAAVDGFFAAGGKRAYVVRVLPGDAIKAQGDPVKTRVASSPPDALQFVARGAGKWADAIRVNLADSRNFPSDAFNVDILWTEGGASRRVESFEDVRMDASHEDYIGERMKASRYVEIVDLFAEEVDAAAGGTLLAAQSPTLAAKTPASATSTYLMYEGKTLTATWWNAGDPDATPVKQSVTFTQTLLNSLGGTPPTFTNGSVQLTAIQLGTLLNAALTNFNAPVPGSNTTAPTIGLKVGKAPTVTIDPVGAATTWDLTGQKLRVTVNGTTLPDITVAAVAAAAVTPAELQAALTSALAPAGLGVAGSGATQVTVTGKGNESATPTLTIVSTPTAARIVTGGAAGTQGLGPDKFDGLRLSLTETSTATAPALLRTLGFAGMARGYGANSAANPLARPAISTGLRLVGGTDGIAAITASDYEGDARERTGLHALDSVDVNIVALPGKNDVSYIAVAMAYCDNRGDCFYVCDGPGGSDRQIEVKPDDAKQFVEALPSRSKNSAMFYPWIRIPDPVGVGRNPTRFVPPSGHIAGIFARTDITRGVWKAPAGIEATVPEAVGLQYQVIDAEQDLLNPISLNCLRQFPNIGIVSWGTRTLSSDPEWRYVPVRRMGLFLKESLRRGLQWAVFEPNDDELWARIAINIKSFMMTLFRQGAFQGTTPDEAFSVVCDKTTNPQENIDAGIVTASVAFAPLKPAEFVVIQISQKSLLVS
ncbi:MAG TPA: phage tail sheath subtilisin-like domain-containing protein [Kofleriaceae bacterium]|nr:phage tail sheath subtilisin-like domain-containing protein [Kofleriaceae bacterium]